MDGYPALARAESLIQLQRWDEALAALGPALGDSNTEAEAWCLRTQALLEKSDLTPALTAARKAIGLRPEDEWPHRLLALVLLRAGNVKDALKAAQEAARLSPYQVETLHVLAICQSTARKKADAEKTAEVLLERLEPNDPDAAGFLAEVLHRQGRRDEAGETLLAAARANPTDGSIRTSLGRIGLPAAVGGFGVFKVVGAVQLARLLESATPAVTALVVGALVASIGGYGSIARIRGTRRLPEQVHRGLMADHRNYALGWLAVAGLLALPLAAWAALAPIDDGRSWGLAVGLSVFAVVAIAAMLRFWTGPLPDVAAGVTRWRDRRRVRRSS
jgi:tetratricopeptide (TPR) repeat protein